MLGRYVDFNHDTSMIMHPNYKRKVKHIQEVSYRYNTYMCLHVHVQLINFSDTLV